MTATTGDAHPSTLNLQGNGEPQTVPKRVLTRIAASVVDDLDLPIHPAKIRTLVDRFVDDGWLDPSSPRASFAAWLDYNDPTGEEAVSNVMHERRQR